MDGDAGRIAAPQHQLGHAHLHMDRAAPGSPAQDLHPLTRPQPEGQQTMTQTALAGQGHHPSDLTAAQGLERDGVRALRPHTLVIRSEPGLRLRLEQSLGSEDDGGAVGVTTAPRPGGSGRRLEIGAGSRRDRKRAIRPRRIRTGPREPAIGGSAGKEPQDLYCE